MDTYPALRVVGADERPHTLRSYADVESKLMLGTRLQQKLGDASLWLQTHGDLYGIRVLGSNEARLLRGGPFFVPVQYSGMRKLTHVDKCFGTELIYPVPTPRSPLVIFDIRHYASGDMEFMNTDVADCLELGIRAEQAIALIDDEDYWKSLRGDWQYTPPTVVIDNTPKT